MTKEEAINKIGELVIYAREQGWDYEYTEAFEVLKGEPCGDAISRQAVLNTLDKMDDALDEDRTVEIYKMLLTECVTVLPPVTPKQKMEHADQWKELKETITEMRDNDGTGTQQEVCKFLANYMEILERQMQEPQESER